MNSLSFFSLSYKKQYRTLMAVETLYELKTICNLSKSDKVSSWMVKWFQSNMVKNFEIPSDKMRQAILFLRKFKPLLNTAFGNELSPYFLNSLSEQQTSTEKIFILFKRLLSDSKDNVHFSSCPTTPVEISYLLNLEKSLNLTPQQIDCINRLIQSFSSPSIDFELIETILLLAPLKEAGIELFNRLCTFPESERKTYLLNLQKLLSAGIKSLDVQNRLLKSFWALSVEQQDAVVLHQSSVFTNMKFKLKIYYLTALSLLPEVEPSTACASLTRIFDYFGPLDSIYDVVTWLESFKNIPTELRSVILLSCAPHLSKHVEHNNIIILFSYLAKMPKKRIPSAAPHLIQLLNLMGTGSYSYVERRMSSTDPNLEFLEDLQPFLNLFKLGEFQSEKSLSNFIYIIEKISPAEITYAFESLMSFRDRILSAQHFTALFRALTTFLSKDLREVIPILIDLDSNLLDRHVSVSLKAFPQYLRKEILIRTIPYFSNFSSDPQFSDFLMTVGLSSFEEPALSATPSYISGKTAPERPPLITLERLKEGPFSCSLIDYIASYLGDKKNLTAVSAAAQWIQHSAMHVFSDSALFFRELAANAFDAQLPLEKQIGNFGMGFYSIFALFYQTQDPIHRIQLTTNYHIENESGAYTMTFYKDHKETLHIHLEYTKSITQGTSIRIYPKKDTFFSVNFLARLEDTLKAFKYFKHGFIKIKGQDKIIGNESSNISIFATLSNTEICIADSGCGIPLSKIYLLLIPSISNKRCGSVTENKALPIPKVRLIPTQNISSVIFTVNSVVNSSYGLKRKFCDLDGTQCDLLIEMDKSFKPNLSRDSIVIPGRKSPQAKALRKMIENCIQETFNHNANPPNFLLMLYKGLQKWECKGLAKDLKGHFTGHFQVILRQELAKSGSMPCHDHGWVIRFKNAVIKENSHYVPLPEELVPEGYTRFELDVVKQFEQMIANHPHQEIKELGLKRQLIEGLSVIFLQDSWLKSDDKVIISSGPCASLLFAPISLLDEGATIETVKRKICQRFVDSGKRLKAVVAAQPVALQTTVIFIHGSSFLNPERYHLDQYLDKELRDLQNFYYEKVDLYLNSPFIKSLDKNKCIQFFWQYFPKLHKKQTITRWDVIFENADHSGAFAVWKESVVNWETRLNQVLIVYPTFKRCYKIRKDADLTEIIEVLKNNPTKFNSFSEKYATLFEGADDEAFKRLSILILIQLGIDPLQIDSFHYTENGKDKPIDLELLEKGVNNFLVSSENMEPQSRAFFYSWSHLEKKGMDDSKDLDRFAPLIINLRPLLTKELELSLVRNLMSLNLLKQESSKEFSPYFDQLFELYYRYLSIPSENFPSLYGTKYSLEAEIENEGFHLHKAVHLMRELPPRTGIKLLQQLIGNLNEKLNIEQRNYHLHTEGLSIPSVLGANTLGIFSLCYSKIPTCMPLINSIICMSAAYEETVSLSLILYFAHVYVPSFIILPFEYQENSLKIILRTVLSTEEPEKINSLLKERGIYLHTLGSYLKEHLTKALQAAIDCIELFAARYQCGLHALPSIFQNPMHLWQQSDLSIFNFSSLMETLFNHPKVDESLAGQSLRNFLELIPGTPNTGRFNDFGMITHASIHGQSYSVWHLPLIELLQNSIRVSANKGDTIKINYALLPLDAEHSQLTYAISDTVGFADLESFLSLLIPGYHPKNFQNTGLGFFRMLPEVSLVHYRTRLKVSNGQIISLIVQPIRNKNNEIVDLKIGMKEEITKEDFLFGTDCRVYMNKQTNIEALMLLRLTKYFAKEIFDEAFFDKEIKFYLNGDCTYANSSRHWGIAQIDTSYPGVFGSVKNHQSKKHSNLFIDGFPHPVDLNVMLDQAGFSFYNLFKNDFISFPKEFFEPIYDPNRLIIKSEYKPAMAKFVLDWIYFHLLNGEIKNGCLKYLEHYESQSAGIEQMISFPEKYEKSSEQILMSLNTEKSYYRFFSQYSYSQEIMAEGVKQKIRLPSFAEYLWQFRNEVYPKWIEEKKDKKRFLTFDIFQQWKQHNQSIFEALKNALLIKANEHLLNLVNNWVNPKFSSLHWKSIDKLGIESRNIDSKTNAPLSAKTSHFALLEQAEPKWVKAKLLVEEALSFYVTEVLLSEAVKNPDVPVILEELKAKTLGRYSNGRISVSLKHHQFSKLLSLILAFAKKETDSHYIGDLLYSEIPNQSGTLNHEIYHALKHAKGEETEGHKHCNGINFEICARKMADQARSKGVLTAFENKVEALLQKYNLTHEVLITLMNEAKRLESTL